MADSRRVEVLLFAGLRQSVGRASVQLELPYDATVADLRAALGRAYPALGALTHCRIAVGQEFADEDSLVPADAELAVIPPVSGGHEGPEPAEPTRPAPTRGSHALLTHAALRLDAVVAQVSHARAGGLTTFTGQVREHSRGLVVEHLEYEAYAPMAVAAMDEIATKIEAQIEGSRVCIHHRLGRLEVGDLAVVIAASAPHRAEAFDACRAAIEALKQDVPIWKKEFDASGGTWIGQGP